MAEANGSGGETRYKIGDVCRIADVQPYVLRYWESEFPVLAPDKSIPGPRTYSARELKLIEQIKRLLYDEGYTIAGAKKRLESEGSGKAESKDTAADTNPAIIPIPEAAEAAEGRKTASAPPPEARRADVHRGLGRRAARAGDHAARRRPRGRFRRPGGRPGAARRGRAPGNPQLALAVRALTGFP